MLAYIKDKDAGHMTEEYSAYLNSFYSKFLIFHAKYIETIITRS